MRQCLRVLSCYHHSSLQPFTKSLICLKQKILAIRGLAKEIALCRCQKSAGGSRTPPREKCQDRRSSPNRLLARLCRLRRISNVSRDLIIRDRPAMFSWRYVKLSQIKRDKADLDIFMKSNSNSRPSPETSRPLAFATEPGAMQYVNQNPSGLLTNSRNFVVTGGNFTTANTIVSTL